jgi:signal transduction histidine kinase/ActR/RegA family two-component response regulator
LPLQALPGTTLTSEVAEQNDPALIRQVNREFAIRAKTGCWFYAAIALAVWLATDLPRRDGPLLVAATLATAVLTAARLWLVRSEWWFGAAGPMLWRHLLGSVLIASGAIWGSLLAYVIATRDLASATTSLMIATMVGLVSGMLHVAAPILRLTTLYLVVVVTPAAISGIVVGGAAGLAFAAINAMFFYVFLSLARNVHKEYWEHLSARRLLEERANQLTAARDAAEAAGRAKLEFLANVSHELRTPMNGVIGMTSLALTTPMSAEQRDLVQTAKDSADSLLTLLNDLLDFSKMDSGKMKMEPIAVAMRPFLEGALKPFRSQAETKGIALKLEIAPECPGAVLADPVRWNQVLVNLVSNALKFTEAGSVTVQATYDLEQETARFVVADTGIGIEAEKQAAIFEAFTQADGSVTRRFGGTGLGLAICTRLVGIWGGQIGVDSVAGRGSQFHFTMPAKPCAMPVPPLMEEPGIAPAITSQSGGLLVLVAEDNLVNQRVAQQVLQKLGHTVRVAVNGRIAVEMATAEPFDLILMDVQMPEMSGLEATAEIRRLEQSTGRHVPIVAVTANAMTGDRERCLAAGMDSYVAKPIRLDDLRDVTNSIRKPVPLPA